jgi:hypothetical protein
MIRIVKPGVAWVRFAGFPFAYYQGKWCLKPGIRKLMNPETNTDSIKPAIRAYFVDCHRLTL